MIRSDGATATPAIAPDLRRDVVAAPEVVAAPSPAAAAARPPLPLERPDAFVGLDAWRGLASLWVLFYHAACVVADPNPVLRSNPLYAASLGGHLGVQLFFVISGYCIANALVAADGRGTSIFGYARARCRRVFPPCWASLVLYAGLSLLASALVARGVLATSTAAKLDLPNQGPLFWLSNITLTQILFDQPLLSIVTWTLCYELAFYIVAGGVYLGLRRLAPAAIRMALLHGVTVASMTYLLVDPHGAVYPFDMWPQFGLGLLLYDLLANRRSVVTWFLAAVVVGQMALFSVVRQSGVGWFQQHGPTVFAVCVGFTLLLAVQRGFDRRITTWPVIRPLVWLGAFSYSLYLTHYLVVGVVTQGLKAATGGQPPHALHFGLMVTLSLVFGWVFYLFFEKPLLKKRPASPAAVMADRSVP